MVALTDLRVACEHKQYDEHIYQTIPNYTGFRQVTVPVTCPGGRPATLEDLGGLGITMGWCKAHDFVVDEGDDCLREGLKSDYPEHDDGRGGCVIVDAFLIPLPQVDAGEEE